MPRLRTTTGLSLLALLVGVAGTGWLSARTEVWPGASPAALALLASPPARTARPQPTRPSHRSHPPLVPAAVRRAPPARADSGDENVASAAAAFTLVPLSTPAAATPYERLRGHLDGRVLLYLTVDGNGHVRQAAVTRSSGDPVLDQHALEVVEGWRFAVPADRPDGLSGELPMRFDTGTPLARTP